MARVLVILAVLSWSVPVLADVPSPEQEACMGKEVGDSCGGGECAMTKCSRARPGPDGKLETMEWDCVQCVPSTASSTGKGRIAIGVVAALVLLGGGVWFAYRKGIARPTA